MLRFIRPRLRKPVGIAIAGAAWSAAWLVHGGSGWLFAIIGGLGTLAWAIRVYLWGRQDSDEGALIGSRADERQALIAQRSWALTGKATMLAAFVGMMVAIAVRATWWWPTAAIFGISGLAYLLGISTYGVGEEGQADENSTEHQAPSPVA